MNPDLLKDVVAKAKNLESKNLSVGEIVKELIELFIEAIEEVREVTMMQNLEGHTTKSSSSAPVDDLEKRFDRLEVSHSTCLRLKGTNEIIRVGPGFNEDATVYTTKSGRSYLTSEPPPLPCFNCGDDHWRFKCPDANRYDADGNNINGH